MNIFGGYNEKNNYFFITVVFLVGCDSGYKSEKEDLNNSSNEFRGLSNLGLEIQRKGDTWSWSCDRPPCTYRYAFSQLDPENMTPDIFNGLAREYVADLSAIHPPEDGVNYLYVQARNGEGRESTIVSPNLDPVRLSVGSSHTCIVSPDNRAKCWGYNKFGQLGQGHVEKLGDDPGEVGDDLPPIDFGEGRTVKNSGHRIFDV